ncbi:MAG: PHP domain-containing protein [Deltaproteobacteria bacterium]|nr:PHP domain-containing protein [Deltaproteobacteria bacterium]MBW2595446.1 PHP domain-containing protein [Deltaproteobacteria bacterium]MBW2650856.1 PHP domain-containing protein [Deltaproteobacteria bacterium]
MLKGFRCDLHIHTCLSPCADLDMYPSALVERSVAGGLDVIGICDHNASENVRYVIEASRGKSVHVFPGMEITSREEVHVIALFENIDNLLQIQKVVYNSLSGTNREEIFGCQAIVNELDEVEGFNDRLLIGSTDLSLQEVVEEIHALDGIAIAAHIDRESFSVLGQLGFIPPDIRFDALEISRRTGLKEARKRYPDLCNHTFIESSDAHFISDIGKVSTKIFMKEPSLSELKMALGKREGRYVEE